MIIPELRLLARADERARLLMTIAGVAELLGLTLACEIADISRLPSARKLVGCLRARTPKSQ